MIQVKVLLIALVSLNQNFCSFFSCFFPSFNFISDNKPVLHIQHKGYLFFKHYKTGEKTYWRCTQLIGHRKRCSARLVTGTSTGSHDKVIEKGRHEHGKPLPQK